MIWAPSDIDLSKERSGTSFDGFSLRFEDLIVWRPKSSSIFNKCAEKDILKGISSKIPKGTMTAIVGPSGSGKTTLMNYLAGRNNESQGFNTHCRYFINGTKIDNVNRFKNIIGYVLQDDIMEDTMTPRKIFRYYAELRGVPHIDQVVEDVIDLMCLRNCADTKIGNVFSRGLSGGERKRTSIGIELVSNPDLLFLDEPTTGLDSSTALEVMAHLADLKARGITIISIIHSPSQAVLDLFDKVLVLVDGRLVYDGRPDKIVDRLTRMKYQVPKYIEPIEYFMKIIDKSYLEIEFEKRGKDKGENNINLENIFNRRIDELVKMQAIKTHAAWKFFVEPSTSIDALIALAKNKNQKLGFWRQFEILIRTSTIVFFKDMYGMLMKSSFFWVCSILYVIVFVNLGDIEEDTPKAIQNRSGLIYMIAMGMFFVGTNLSSTLFIPVKQILLKDKQARLYDDGPFFLVTQLYNVPLFFLNVSIFIVIIFFATKLNYNPHVNLLWYWLFSLFASFFGGGAFGLILGVIAERMTDLSLLLPAIVFPQFVITGYFANVKTMTWPLYALSFASPARYAFQGLILTEFNNRDKYINNCNVTIKNSNGDKQTVHLTGDQAQRCDPFTLFDFDQKTKWLNLVIAVCLTIGYRILAFVLFKIKYREKNAVIVECKEKAELYSLRDTYRMRKLVNNQSVFYNRGISFE